MKRIIPFFAAAVAVSVFSTDATAQSRKIQRVERINGDHAVIVTETIRSQAPVIVSPNVGLGVGTEVVRSETTPAGADAEGVAWGTGAGIGEGSTRSDVGTGRGGAGIVRSGTLAPRVVRGGSTEITTVPAEVVPSASGTYVVRPIIPRRTTNTNTLGSGTSTPVGVAPGY